MKIQSESYPKEIQAIRKAELSKSVHELYIPLRGKHTINPDEEPFDLVESLNSFFEFKEESTSDPKVMLLLGDAGSGKSVFSQQLHQQLWKAYQSGDPIPLWIPLPELAKPFERAVEEVLLKYGFTEAQITELKAKERFIFVVDGYDELHCFQNCHSTNKWEQWKAKVLMTCRTQALYNKNDYEKYFMPYRGEKPLPLLLRKTYVAPFSKEQISAYVEKYQQLKTAHKMTEEDFSKVLGLPELLTSPFMLHLAVESLPDILANQAADENSKEMTQAKLYDVFIERWFTRQIGKLRETRHVKSTDLELKKQFWEYCKNLAMLMHEKQVSMIPYQGPKAGGRLFAKQEQENPWEIYFSVESEIVRSACPLKRYGEHQYGFVHASLVNYFTNRAMFDTRKEDSEDDLLEASGLNASDANDAQGSEFNSSVKKPLSHSDAGPPEEHSINQESNLPRRKNRFQNPLYNDLITDNPLDVSLFADRVKEDEKYKHLLLEIIEKSKKKPRYAIGAANAITGLVKAGVHFNRAKLSGIRIPGADISGGFFDEADISNADLSNVQMKNVWLRGASIKGCKVAGVNFGEYPWFKHEGPVTGLDYREDLQFLLVTAFEIVLWNTITNDKNELIPWYGNIITCAQFSPKGDILVLGSGVGGSDKTIRILRVDNRTELAQLQGGDVNCVAFSPNGEMIASGDNKTVKVWSVVSASQVIVLNGHEDKVVSVAFSSNGKHIVSGSHDKRVRIWDIQKRNQSKVILAHNGHVFSVAFNPNGEQVVSGGADNAVKIWDTESGMLIAVLHGHEDIVTSVAFNLHGDRLASGSKDKTVYIWEVANKKVVTILRGHESAVNCVQFNSNGQQIISGSRDFTVRIWDIPKEPSIVRAHEHNRYINDVLINLTGTHMISIGNTSVRFSELSTGKDLIIIHVDVGCAAFNPNESLLATVVYQDKKIRIWDVTSGKIVGVLHGHNSDINCLTFSCDGKLIASGSDDNTIRIWGIAFKDLIKTLKNDAVVSRVEFTKDMKRVISGCDDGTVRIWDVHSGLQLKMLVGFENLFQISISSNEEIIAVIGYSSLNNASRLYVNELNSGEELADLRTDKIDIALKVQFINDKKWVIVGGGGRAIQIWDIIKKQCINAKKFHAQIDSFAYYNNETLVICFHDNSIECWQNVGTEDTVHWQLKWTTYVDSPNLFVEELNASKVYGISHRNRQLLMQRGAKNVPMAHRELTWKAANESGSSPTLKSPRENTVKIGFFKGKSPPSRHKDSLAVQDSATEDSNTSELSVVDQKDNQSQTTGVSSSKQMTYGSRGRIRKLLPKAPQSDDEQNSDGLSHDQPLIPAPVAPIQKAAGRGTIRKVLPKIPPPANTGRRSDPVNDDAQDSFDYSKDQFNI